MQDQMQDRRRAYRLVLHGVTATATVLLAAACGSEPQDSVATLQIEHLVEGSGEMPVPTSTVRVHYHGTFQDGTVFDSSVDRGSPAVFPLNRVIACWRQGLQQIRVGGKARLVCPPELAYGAQGKPPKIPPQSTLVFEVELIAIE